MTAVNGSSSQLTGGEPARPGELKAQVRRSLGWTLASQLVVRIVTVGSTVVLLRLITPAEFGAYIFALATVTIVMAVNDIGQVVAVTRSPAADLEASQRTSTTIAWTTSSVAFAGCLAGAGPIARLGGSPQAVGLIRLMAVMLLIDGLTSVPRGLVLRSFRHHGIARSDVAGVLVNVAVTLALALAGARAWAPAFGTVTAAAVTAGVVLASSPARPRPGWNRHVVRSVVGFGAPVAAAQCIELLLLNVDYVIVANQLGATALGLYAVAFNVASWPATLFTQAIRRVSVAGFANVEDNRGDVSAAFARSLVLLVAVLLPLCVGLAVLAEPLLRILYGGALVRAAQPLTWLVVLAGVRVSTGLVSDVLLSQGRSKATVRLQALWLVAAVPALVIGSEVGGLGGVAAAHALVGFAVALPLHAHAVRNLEIDPRTLVRSLLRPAVAAAAMAAVGVAAMALVGNPWQRILVAGAAMSLTYVAGAVRPAQIRRALG